MSKSCCSSSKQRMILACSGGSNVGQATNKAAVELTREGFGKMYCLAGVGGGLQAFVQSTRDNEELLVLDGCPVGCAKAILDNAGITPRHYIVATALGIEKVKDAQLLVRPEDVDLIKQAAREGGGLESAAGENDNVTVCSCATASTTARVKKAS